MARDTAVPPPVKNMNIAAEQGRQIGRWSLHKDQLDVEIVLAEDSFQLGQPCDREIRRRRGVGDVELSRLRLGRCVSAPAQMMSVARRGKAERTAPF
jgi:hypothetical protein